MTGRAPASIPGPDPLDTATQWLNLHEDDECSIHPIHRSTVAAIHAAAVVARIAAKDARRERDEAVALVRELMDPSPCLMQDGWCHRHDDSSPCVDHRAQELVARLDPGVGL